MPAPKEIRRRARGRLEGNYLMAVGMNACMLFLTYALFVLLLNSGLNYSENTANHVLYWALLVVGLLLAALFKVGLIRFLRSLCMNDPVHEFSMMFYGFRVQPDVFILTYAFRYLLVLIWFVPALYLCTQLPGSFTFMELLPRLVPIVLLALAACIPAVLLALPFCMTTYVLLDYPNMSARDALKNGLQVTKRHRRDIFKLWLGFLPLCILSLCSFGIGFFWVQPYYHASMAELYLTLTGRSTTEGIYY